MSAAWYALLGSLGVDWFYCVFFRVVRLAGERNVLTCVRRGRRPSDHWLCARAVSSASPCQAGRGMRSPATPPSTLSRRLLCPKRYNTYRRTAFRESDVTIHTYTNKYKCVIYFVAIKACSTDSVYGTSIETFDTLLVLLSFLSLNSDRNDAAEILGDTVLILIDRLSEDKLEKQESNLGRDKSTKKVVIHIAGDLLGTINVREDNLEDNNVPKSDVDYTMDVCDGEIPDNDASGYCFDTEPNGELSLISFANMIEGIHLINLHSM